MQDPSEIKFDFDQIDEVVVPALYANVCGAGVKHPEDPKSGGEKDPAAQKKVLKEIYATGKGARAECIRQFYVTLTQSAGQMAATAQEV